MKKNLNKALLLTLGLGLAVSLTSCHSDSNESAPEITTNITPKHSIRGIILDGNGNALNGASVTLSRQGTASLRVIPVSGNTFEVSGLDDGNWVVEVSKNGFKSQSETVSLAVRTETIEGTTSRVGQNVDEVFYLAEEMKSKSIKLGAEAATTDEIVIETTAQDNGTGNIVNTTDPASDKAQAETITVEAETPAISGDDYDNVADQLEKQGGTIDDFSMYLVNITSLEDAKELAEEAATATSRLATRANTSLPGGLELLAGVGINAGPFAITLPGNLTIDITITLPDNNCKNAVSLFRTLDGNSWTPLTVGGDVVAIDNSQNSVIVIRMNTIQTQSLAVGVQINETTGATRYEPIQAQPVVNTSANTMQVSQMPYVMKDGVVIANTVNGSLTDFLRKIVLRKYGTRAVSDVQTVSKSYQFSPAYQLPAYGTLYLMGYQTVVTSTFSVTNGSAAFTSTDYGTALLYPYAVYPEPENTHVGGGN